MKTNRVYRSVFSVTGLLVLAKLLGFVKQMLVASSFGTTIETDLINLSQGVVNDIQYLLAQSLITAFVSVYIHHREDGSSDAFAANVLKLFLLLSGALALLCELFAPWIARLLAPSYTAELSARLCAYLRLFLLALPPLVAASVFQAMLNANERFAAGESQGLSHSVWLILILLLWRDRLGIGVLSVSFFAYILWNAVFLGVLSRPYWRRGLKKPLQSSAVRDLLRMIGPLLLGYSLVSVNQIVDKIIGSGLGEGAVSAMGYGLVLQTFVATFIFSFGNIFYPYITQRIAAQEHAGAAHLAEWTATVLLFVLLPITVLIEVCSTDIVTAVFGRGAFNAESVRMTAAALRGYGFALVPLALREVYSRVQYGYQDSRHPMINSSLSIGCNIVLSIVLSRFFGIWGVCFATSASVFGCSVLNVFSAKRCNAFLRWRAFLPALPFLAVGSVVCYALARLGQSLWVGQGAFVRFVLTTLLSGAAYCVICIPLILRLLRNRPSAPTERKP